MDSENIQLDLNEIFNEILRKKWVVLISFAVFSIAGVLYSLSLPNIYKADILLVPSSSDGQMQKLAGQFGGLAALTGINVGASSENKTSLGLATLTSRLFINDFIDSHKILLPLMAIEKWDPVTGDVVIDSSLYDIEKNVWIRPVKAPKESKPSDWEAYKKFLLNLEYKKVPENGFISVSYQSQSPILAAKWVSLLVADLNSWLKRAEIAEINSNIDFLKEQVSNTGVTEMKKIFYQLIEEQVKNLMLAQSQNEYAFKIIDPAVIPEEKNSPKRALICILTSFLGFSLSILMIVLKYTRKR